MSFYFYWDKLQHTAKVHHASCGCCRDGNGMHGHQEIAQNEWRPAPGNGFRTRQRARLAARRLGIRTVSDCRIPSCRRR